MSEMWASRYNNIKGYIGFFLIALSHNTLANYYMLNFSLMQHHKYSLTEIESMIPWEREIYVNMLVDHLEREKAARET
jgi:hypothetical protein